MGAQRGGEQNEKSLERPSNQIKKGEEWHPAEEMMEYGQQNKSGDENSSGEGKTEEVQKPDFGLSGKLAQTQNTVDGVVLKYAEPEEARKPKRHWKLFVFKGQTTLEPLQIHRQSCYLLGRERKVCDIPIDHPSCSKQHAVIQYRQVRYEKPDGLMGKKIRPYLLDLESANGSFLNGKKIEPRRYHEMKEKDVLKFGFSTREYVLMYDEMAVGEED